VNDINCAKKGSLEKGQILIEELILRIGMGIDWGMSWNHLIAQIGSGFTVIL